MGEAAFLVDRASALEDIHRCVAKYGCRNFVFKDSTFTANKKWAEQFCDALTAARLNIKWRCNTRVNLVPQPLLEKMKKAGCYVINFGVESGHPQSSRYIHKEVSLEDVHDAHRRCRRIGIRTYATFLIGSPGETEETVQATIEVARDIRPNLAMFFVATAYPGTPLYEQAVREGIVEPRWWAAQTWDPRKHSAFQMRWGWTARGAIRIPGFDAEKWHRRATGAFYLSPLFRLGHAALHAHQPEFLEAPAQSRQGASALLQAAGAVAENGLAERGRPAQGFRSLPFCTKLGLRACAAMSGTALLSDPK